MDRRRVGPASFTNSCENPFPRKEGVRYRVSDPPYMFLVNNEKTEMGWSFYTGRNPIVTSVFPVGNTTKGPSSVTICTSMISTRLLRRLIHS